MSLSLITISDDLKKSVSIALRPEKIGITKRDNTVEISLLEHSVREDLNKRAPRVMAVLQPLKIVIENYPEEQTEELAAVNNPENPEAGTRNVPFSRELFIEQNDFMEDPPRKYFRLAPGREIRLRYAYFITCTQVIKDENGHVIEIRCTYDPETKGGSAPDGRKVKGTIHWVSAKHYLDAEVRLYDRLFSVSNPGRDGDFKKDINTDSLQVLTHCKVEPSLKNTDPNVTVQFERKGYFCIDLVDSSPDHLIFNRTVPLRDSWKKIEKSQQKDNK